MNSNSKANSKGFFRILSIALRVSIVVLLLLPLMIPTVQVSKPVKYSKNVTIVTNRSLNSTEKYALVDSVKQYFGQSSAVRIQDMYAPQMNEVQAYDEVGQAVQKLSGLIVLDLDNTLWGEVATHFQNKILATEAARSGRLFLSGNSENSSVKRPARFVMVSDFYIPKVTFLGEETLSVIEISGRLEPNEQQSVELVIRSNAELVTTLREKVTADSSGHVKSTIEVPVSFLKAQTQILSVQLKSEDALAPLDAASTTVFVAHGKTTVLHVAVGPDWSVRTMRQKLKFWPNLDLLSYYILRERWDDNSIPPNQLSLIEFPADKLFGEQLPNFHGIIAQNFFFDHYLGRRDALNLVEYVRQGGRMFLQAGPLSFLSQEAAINALFPCKNTPEYIAESAPIRWRIPRENEVQLSDDLANHLPLMSTSQYFKGCQPKEGVISLAELSTGDPILLASTLDKGLVVTALASDWHTSGTRPRVSPPTAAQIKSENTQTKNVLASQAATSLNSSLQTTAAEKLTDWIIEFLQRRQDSGLRPPDLYGPRIFKEDRFLLTRSRGVVVHNSEVTLFGSLDGGKKVSGRIVTLPFLEKEGILLEKPVGVLAEQTPLDGSTLIEVARTHENSERSSIRRGGLWAVHSRADLVIPENQKLLEGIPTLAQAAHQTQTTEDSKSFGQDERPLLEVYPFLVALALGLFFLDTVLNLFFISSATHSKQKFPAKVQREVP